jgi:predicted enzyme related to lactoylglutathione lyase
MPKHHAIDYIEFPVTDLARAKEFYAQAFGWEFTDYGPGYCGIKSESGEMGGLSEVESVRTGGVLCVLWSDDLERSEASLLDAGGVIVKAIFSFPGGRRFEFTDPFGNQLAVWSSHESSTSS